MDYYATGTFQDAGADGIFSTSYFKRLARRDLEGKWGAFIVVALLLSVFTAVVSSVPLAGLAFAGIGPVGFVAISMAVVRGSMPTMADAFSGFNNFWRNLLAVALIGIYTFLWGLLLIIPGIIKGFSYAATLYILNRYPGMGADDAITMSRSVMDGHKLELFILTLSFIGWLILVPLTFGLAAFYVFPYMQTTMAEFFTKLLDEPPTQG